jgi:DNA topoisomerase-1
MRLRGPATNGSAPDPIAAAGEADLTYVSDSQPGIRRLRTRTGFRYVTASGRPLRDSISLARIKRIAIPPAWTDVWICPISDGHLQASGRDARKRKQYRYHERWRQVRDQNKHERTIAFAEALPLIRKRVEEDLSRPGLLREKVIAVVVRLLETTLIRVGNREYADANNSFGLTTLRDRHAGVSTSAVRFSFTGKGGKKHIVSIRDRTLARIVKRCQELKGQELFQYLDEDDEPQTIGSADVNSYLREVNSQDFSAKDFRTWAGTVLAAIALQELETSDSEAKARRNLLQAVESVAGNLGNTVSICRKCYIHPGIIDGYLDGTLVDAFRQRAGKLRKSVKGLKPEEAAVLALLRDRLKQSSRELKRGKKSTSVHTNSARNT